MYKCFALLFFPLCSFAIDIHERFSGSAQSPVLYKGDSCSGSGFKWYIKSNDYYHNIGVAICKQTSGKNPLQKNYVIKKKSFQNQDNTIYVGCSVEEGVSTGYKIIWWDTGNYVPSSIMDAQKSVVLLLDQKGRQILLKNPNQSRAMVVSYTTNKNVNKIESIPVNDMINFLNGYTVNSIKYTYTYSGTLICDW